MSITTNLSSNSSTSLPIVSAPSRSVRILPVNNPLVTSATPIATATGNTTLAPLLSGTQIQSYNHQHLHQPNYRLSGSTTIVRIVLHPSPLSHYFNLLLHGHLDLQWPRPASRWCKHRQDADWWRAAVAIHGRLEHHPATQPTSTKSGQLSCAGQRTGAQTTSSGLRTCCSFPLIQAMMPFFPLSLPPTTHSLHFIRCTYVFTLGNRFIPLSLSLCLYHYPSSLAWQLASILECAFFFPSCLYWRVACIVCKRPRDPLKCTFYVQTACVHWISLSLSLSLSLSMYVCSGLVIIIIIIHYKNKCHYFILSYFIRHVCLWPFWCN